MKAKKDFCGDYCNLTLSSQIKSLILCGLAQQILDCFANYFYKSEEQYDFVCDAIKDFVDGTKKKHVTDWWLNHIKQKADKVWCCVSSDLSDSIKFNVLNVL